MMRHGAFHERRDPGASARCRDILLLAFNARGL
jgi:hypothetical protein